MPDVWLLSGGNAGDENQMKMLAEALGWPYTLKPSRPPMTRVLSHRIFWMKGLAGDAAQPASYAPPWPDLIITSGGRNVSIARRIQKLSGGRTRLVQVGRPWAPLDWFDLIITTPQYRLPARANVLHNAAPLSRISETHYDKADQRLIEKLRNFPRPHIVVFIGGNSGSYRFNVASARTMAKRLNALAAKYFGSLLVTTSARTPAAAADALIAGISAPAHCYAWKADDPGNPYQDYLAVADMFVVTGDSASMLADACGTGREVLLYDIPQRLRSRLLVGVAKKLRNAAQSQFRLTRALGRWYQALTERGFLMSPRDLRFYHQELRARGLLRHHDEAVRPIKRKPLTDLSQAVERIRALMREDGSNVGKEANGLQPSAERGSQQ